jgi:hypothetical protein
MISLDFASAPPLQINHDRRPSTSRDDPEDVLVALVHLLVFGPCGDEGEVAGREGLFLIRYEIGMGSKEGTIVQDITLRCELTGESEGTDEVDEGPVLVGAGAGVGARDGLVIIMPWPLPA